ncbi:MAG: hypothetical protein ABFD75_07725 [Smithella sp.]
MENLLNAEVIKAAASSTLGILCLMCLILGIVVLALFRNAPVSAKIFVFVLLILGAGGFGYTVIKQKSPTGIPEITRQFIAGRWHNEQKIGDLEAGSVMTYFEDGTFLGSQESFFKGKGGRTQVKGKWDVTKLAEDKCRIKLNFDDGKQWQGIFKILDHDRAHNIDENYDSVRISK